MSSLITYIVKFSSRPQLVLIKIYFMNFNKNFKIKIRATTSDSGVISDGVPVCMVSRREHSSAAVIWLSPGRCAQSIPPHTDTGTHHSAHEHTSHGLRRQEGGARATAHGISHLAARAFLREVGGEVHLNVRVC